VATVTYDPLLQCLIIVVDGGGEAPSTSPSAGEVDRYGPLCLEHGLAMVYSYQLGLDGRLLASEFTPPLCGPALDVCLSSMSSCLLLLLIGLLSLREEASVRL
jgi:hypothetical protein